jgi:hypothetical protein
VWDSSPRRLLRNEKQVANQEEYFAPVMVQWRSQPTVRHGFSNGRGDGEQLYANPVIFARINKAHATNELRRSHGVKTRGQKASRRAGHTTAVLLPPPSPLVFCFCSQLWRWGVAALRLYSTAAESGQQERSPWWLLAQAPLSSIRADRGVEWPETERRKATHGIHRLRLGAEMGQRTGKFGPRQRFSFFFYFLFPFSSHFFILNLKFKIGGELVSS